MTTPDHALYPNYEVPPSPHPRRTFEDLTLIAADSAERFSGLFTKGTALASGFRHLALLIEAWDSDPTPPQGADAHLATVANVSQDWGCYRPRGGGKVLWAELGVPRQRSVRHTCGDYA